ncbi:MAG: hypothetical protein R3Y56_06215 [Akkermansia sp.]
MAIKLQDWGMIPTPARQAVMRSEGIDAVARANKELGKSVGEAIDSARPYGKMLDELAQYGDIADIAKKVHDIAAETSSNLESKDLSNWQYRWSKETQPRIKEVLDQYAAPTREVGHQVAEAIAHQASLQAKQNMELSYVQESTDKWAERLGDAEQKGDVQQCNLWLRAGRGSFFPESEYEQKQAESQSRCQLSSWKNRLDSAPLATLADLEEAAESSLPAGETERQHIKLKQQKVKQGVRSEMGNLFIQHIKEGVELEAQQLELAKRAHIISPKQYADATTPTPKHSKAYELCHWVKTLDELDTEDEEAYTQVKLSLGTAQLATKDKQALLKRLDHSQGVNLSDRRNLSRQLWNLYEQGYLGARSDESSLRRLRRLQEEGLAHIRDAGAEDTAEWIQSRKNKANSWICFSPNTNKQQADT